MKISLPPMSLLLPLSLSFFRAGLVLTASLMTMLAAPAPASAQNGNRWYQIEVTVFAHENSNLQQEQWPTQDLALSYPEQTRELDSLLKHLSLDDWSVLQPVSATRMPSNEIAVDGDSDEPLLSPGPNALRSSNYRLPDTLRDAFVALPAADHDFTQTNRALTQSTAYRVLYHNAWRQPVLRAPDATPIAIAGGRQFGQHHELEGTLTIRFNQSRDRVLLDTNLWLARFSSQLNSQPPEQSNILQLPLSPFAPDLPEQTPDLISTASDNQPALTERYYASQVFAMNDSRPMRSNEFHYLDHPAIGVLVQVFPYEPPAPPASAFPGSGAPL